MAKTSPDPSIRDRELQAREPEGITSLHLAAWNGHTRVLGQLVEAGAGIDDPSHDGKTALQLAAMQGHIECVQYLMNNNCDINHRDSQGRTALHYAAGNSHSDVVVLLLANKAGVRLADIDGMTALDLAQRTGDARRAGPFSVIYPVSNYKPRVSYHDHFLRHIATMQHDQKKPFQSARLTFRALETEDEAFIHEVESEPLGFINSQLSLKRPQSRKDTKKQFDWLSDSCLLGVIVCLTESDGVHEAGKPIGALNLTGLSGDLAHHRHTEMGLGLVPACQGKGYGSEAIEWALQWAFESAGMHRVSVKAFEYNLGARKLYEKLGLTLEGKAREMFWHDGRWWDDFEYSILEHEWRARRADKIDE